MNRKGELRRRERLRRGKENKKRISNVLEIVIYEIAERVSLLM